MGRGHEIDNGLESTPKVYFELWGSGALGLDLLDRADAKGGTGILLDGAPANYLRGSELW